MNRANYYNYIEEKLHTLARRIITGGKLNMLALHLHSESFYQHFFNLIYGYNLINLNQESQNVEAIDLIDRDEKIVIQVSSTSTKAKIEGALDKKSLMDYSDYTFKFISIANDASHLRQERKKDKNTNKYKMMEVIYKNPHSIDFESSRDIYDITSILSKVNSLNIDKLKEVFDFIQKELGDNSSKLNQNLTTKLGKSTIKGRKKELQEIEEHLNSSKALLIHGIGGIGKSTIVSYYLYQHKNEFDYYGFFEGLDDFINKLEIVFKIKVEQGQDRLTVVLHELTKLDGNKLLVIDNIQEVTENKKTIEKILDLKEHDGFKILLTSREEIDGIDKYLLDTLSVDDAKELFNSIYKVEDDVLLEEILEYLDCHAFFVEKIAQTLKNKKGLLTLEDIKDKFDNHQFPDIRVKKKESFNKLLKELFTIDELEKDEILLLKQLSILPSIHIKLDFLSQIFQVDDIVKFQENLEYLSEKGWINSSNNSYKLHQIIKEFMLLPNNTPCFKEIKEIFVFFSKLIENSRDIEIAVKNEKIMIYLLSLNKVLEIVDVEYEKVVDFFINLGYIYHYSGHFKQAQPLLEKLSKVNENIFGKKHLTTAISYNNLAQNYKLLGQYDQAITYHYQALEIRQEILGENHLDTAESYHNIAGISQNTEKSEELYIKALKIREAIVEKEHPIIASSYNGLGELYKHKKKYKKALFFHRNALKIRGQKLGKTHPHTILSYHNLATVFHSLGKFKKAQKLFKKGLSINIEKRDKDFYGTEIFKENLSRSLKNDKGILLLDEPEISMHFELQNSLLETDNKVLIDREKYSKRDCYKGIKK